MPLYFTETTSMELSVVKNAVCTFCGCVCDDIELHADAERIIETKRACVLGESWFKHHTAERLYPPALIDGRQATVDEAIERAADILEHSDLPLIYGLSNITCEAQREAVWLAETVGAVIDSHTSL
jgi:formylmethanofuran dehydrogenase subunit B